MQSNSQNPQRRHTSAARKKIIDATPLPDFDIGARVFHKKFGYGEVMAIEGDKLVIEFDKAGDKNILAQFVTLASDVKE